MQRAANSLILSNPPSVRQSTDSHVGLAHTTVYDQVLKQLIKGVRSKRAFIDLGDRLIALAEQAYGLRLVDKLEELSQALLALPLPRQYASAARYFQGLALIRRGEFTLATSVLEEAVSDPPHGYTARAIQSIGSVLKMSGDLESALKVHIDAGRRATEKGRVDFLTAAFVQRNIAVLKSMRGNHRGALSDLQRMAPLARAVSSIHPYVYYDYLNSLAVEFSQVGRLEEAAHVSRVAVSSPFAPAYPEWRETFCEIASKVQQPATHSAVAVRQPVAKPRSVEDPGRDTQNLLQLRLAQRPIGDGLEDRNDHRIRARVLNFQQWKLAIKASSGDATRERVTAEQRARMTTGEKLIRLMDLISQDHTDDETIDRILEAVEQIVQKRRSERLD